MENQQQGNDKSYHSFLMSLIGKTVTIYRGGPEKKTGVLLDVQSDYIALTTTNDQNKEKEKDGESVQAQQQNNVVYYQVQHIKSISENSKMNSLQAVQPTFEDRVDYLKAETFAGLVQLLAKEQIKINQGGPESKRGTLLDATEDHIVLYTEDDGVVYFNTYHVKSISKEVKEEKVDKCGIVIRQEKIFPDFMTAGNFQELFSSLNHKWVSINRGGPEAMEGVLVENVGGHYTVVKDQEVLRIHPYHIKSISTGPKGSFKNSEQNNENNNSNGNENRNKNRNRFKRG